MTIADILMGTVMKKTALQEKDSTSQPPSHGPSAAIPPEIPAHSPMALPRCSSVKQTFIIARLCGIISAEPIPCKAWNIIRYVIVWANPESMAPVMNIMMPKMKIRFRPYLSPNEPPINRKAPRESR